MDTIVFLISVIVIFIGYFSQIYKIYKVKDTLSISPASYFVGFVANASLYISSINEYVTFITALGMFLSAFVFLTIIYFDYKNNKLKVNIKTSKALLFGFIGSLFGIFGIAQSIVCFENNNDITHVSFQSYIVWATYAITQLYLGDSIMVLTAASLSLIFYFYVIYNSYLKRC